LNGLKARSVGLADWFASPVELWDEIVECVVEVWGWESVLHDVVVNLGVVVVKGWLVTLRAGLLDLGTVFSFWMCAFLEQLAWACSTAVVAVNWLADFDDALSFKDRALLGWLDDLRLIDPFTSLAIEFSSILKYE
jgi:hypothetical protein